MIDFVNLRKDDYSNMITSNEDNFGTPLEDALRRDFTINSLFYNINEGIIEDFTLKGIDDL